MTERVVYYYSLLFIVQLFLIKKVLWFFIRITRSIHMTNAVFRFGKNEALRFLLSLSALYNNDKIDKMVID